MNKIDSLQEDNLKAEKDKSVSSNASLKIIWKQSPELFFLLFSTLIEEGFISTKKKGIDEFKTARVLYDVFDVLPKVKNKKNYTFNTFYQYIKSSSSYQSEIKQNKIIKSKIVKFLKSLEPIELSLFN